MGSISRRSSQLLNHSFQESCPSCILFSVAVLMNVEFIPRFSLLNIHIDAETERDAVGRLKRGSLLEMNVEAISKMV